MYRPTIIRPSDHEAWLGSRKEGIGASEVGAILGLSHFATPYSVWRQKRGLDGPTPENMAMIMGHLLEDAVAQRFVLEAEEWTIVKASAADIIYSDPKKPYMRVTPDRIMKKDKEKALLEAKTTARAVDPNDLPLSWLCQVQYQMRVTGIHKAFLAWLVNGRDFGYAEIPYDGEFVKYIEDRVDEFWAVNVMGGVEPPIINIEDVAAKYPTSSPDKMMTADAEALNDIKELASVKKQIKVLEAREEHLTNNIKVFMGDSEFLVGDDVKLVSWKTGKSKMEFNKALFAKENPDLYKRYTRETPGSRTFRLSVKDDE